MHSTSPRPGPAPARQFEAIASFGRRGGALVVVSVVVVVAALTAMNTLLIPQRLTKTVVPISIGAFVVCYAIVLVTLLRGKKLRLAADAERVVLEDGKGTTFPLASAELGLWRVPSVGVTCGTVLHLRNGERSYRIGGRDHRCAPDTLLRAPIVETVDAYLSGAEFQALVTRVALARVAGYRDAGATRAALRYPLLSNPWSTRRVIRNMAPWFVAMGVAMAIAATGSSVGFLASPRGQYILMPTIVAVLVGGIIVTILHARPKSPGLEIEADQEELRLRDATTGAVLSVCNRAAIRVARGMHRFSSGRMTLDYPVMTIEWPGRRPISVGVTDVRFGWKDPTPKAPPPPYVVGPPDWIALAEALHLQDVVSVAPG